MGSGRPSLGPRPLSLFPSGRPFPLALLRWASSNVTFTLLFGQRFDYRDPVFVALVDLIDEVMVLLGTPSLQVREVAAPSSRSWGQVAESSRDGVEQVTQRAPSAEPPWLYAQVWFWWRKPRPVPCAVRKERRARAGAPSPLPHPPFSSALGRTGSRGRPPQPALSSVAWGSGGHRPRPTLGTLGRMRAIFPVFRASVFAATVLFLFSFKIFFN